MKTTGNTILITGGATGIGFALLEEFVKAGSKVKICGRRLDRLEQVKARYPDVDILQCDVTDKAQRIKLFEWATADGNLNVLINNAGAQRNWLFTESHDEDYDAGGSEIELTMTAPVHLCELFIPYLMKKDNAVIINVCSFLAVVPLSSTPVYSASKAGLHSFTRCIRQQLEDSGVKVFELLPPAVVSEINPTRRALGILKNLIETDVYARTAIEALEADVYEVYPPLMDILENKSLKEMYEYFLDPTNPRG